MRRRRRNASRSRKDFMPETKPDVQELGFDADALRRKYQAERDKRLRVDANEQ